MNVLDLDRQFTIAGSSHKAKTSRRLYLRLFEHLERKIG
jgi:hypothetical protein